MPKCLINTAINAIDFRLECVVNALCRGLSHASGSLSRLVLDMNLSGEQVSRVCEALRDCIQVQALHLPHLGCGCEGLASVAELLKERPLLALNLAGSWGAKNEDPSSSGISMGKTLLLLSHYAIPSIWYFMKISMIYFVVIRLDYVFEQLNSQWRIRYIWEITLREKFLVSVIIITYYNNYN